MGQNHRLPAPALRSPGRGERSDRDRPSKEGKALEKVVAVSFLIYQNQPGRYQHAQISAMPSVLQKLQEEKQDRGRRQL